MGIKQAPLSPSRNGIIEFFKLETSGAVILAAATLLALLDHMGDIDKIVR
jgi:hypothetical protein